MKRNAVSILCVFIFLTALGACCEWPDTDGDGVGDLCEDCPLDPLKLEPGLCGCGTPDTDDDGDGFIHCFDNCPYEPNPDQADIDMDDVGDVCDTCTDSDDDGYGDPGFPGETCDEDNCPDVYNPDQADADADGTGDACEDPVGWFFNDISESSGIQDENFDPDPVLPIPINDHSRLGFADINGDGYDDIVMHNLYPNPMSGGIPFEHLVFLNNGDKTFTNFSDESGLRNIQAGFFAFGDVDNDGDLDCFAGFDYIDYSHRHTLLLNDGAGHFTVRAGSGLEGSYGQAIAGNAVFADFNGDANLDLFIGNGHTSYAATDKLHLGNGDGTFTDATSNLQGAPDKPSNGSVACDYDDDGDLDIFVSTYGVSHENGHNLLWENDGTGLFTNVARDRGFAYQTTGNYYLSSTGYGLSDEPWPYAYGTAIGSNGFGLECRDVNNDGYMDVFASAISHPVSSDYKRKWSDPTLLLINQGPAGGYGFVNEFLDRGLPFNEGDVDAAVVDFDNDGHADLSLSRDKKYEGGYPAGELDQKAWFGLMQQRPSGDFRSVGLISGINDEGDSVFLKMKGAQNHAWADIDRDGDLDLLVGGRKDGVPGVGRPNFLFENIIGSKRNWIALELRGDGVTVNREAIGARVTLTFGDQMIVREVKSSRGMYNSMDTRILHFGLGSHDGDYTVTVRWPNGAVGTYSSAYVALNSFTTIPFAP